MNFTEDQAWVAAGGNPERLALYRSLQPVLALTDGRQRALAFDNGCVGDFSGDARFLAEVESLLRARGLREAVGPMDGSSFFAYRCGLGPWDTPPMPSEPLGSPSPWRAAGWREDARFVSIYAPISERLLKDRGLPPGWRVRDFDRSRVDQELASIYAVTLRAFAGAHRYAPIPFAAFAALYRPLLPVVDPHWVVLLEDDTGCVRGYFLNFPAGDVFICKTLAIDPELQGGGAVWAMVALIHQRARAAGMHGGVHYLMHEGAVSTFFCGPQSRVVRRYALYRKRL
jgi:hypothetical protein